ncbi:MAG: UTP--glucose-1-phosphate uridylyltransferase [uncultured Acidimicrobiales bacterium]|uniref:UTP--glucose-1-phosphate uridylyltransferase n=1 Tax=uncultured Acidimicrobiales bacterium TaxID=310071 RepID=A0A6J4I2Z2_9ACTN|nr:MAG: UTP--glucose-1-phosphate uridylyltransferase [uncultured Acidimicrobiales bacterium]
MASVRTAVIPAAGLGTRFLPASKAVPKEMVTLVDRPAIQWVVEEAVAAGCSRVVMVVGRGKEAIADHFDRAPELEASLEASGKRDLLAGVRGLADMAEVILVRQGEPRGLGHAVGVARPVIRDEPFAVLLPDDVFHPSTLLAEMVASTEATGRSTVAVMRIVGPEISTKGVAAVDGRRVLDVVEKPRFEDAPSDLALMGRYVFTPAVFDALDRIGQGALGELQLTDAIRLLAHEEGVEAQTFEGGYFDTGNHLDWLCSNVELALGHPTIGGPLAERLAGLMRRRGIGP